MENSTTFLNTVPFSDLINWSFQYLGDNEFSYNEDYKLVTLGSFLTRNKTVVDIQDDIVYKRVTVSAQNRGIKLRDSLLGKKIGTKKQFIVSENQFLLSKIDARNGAFGIVPSAVDGAIITGNFWTYDVDYSMINPTFLSLIVTTPEFIEFCERASNGTTNRHYLQEDLFLTQQIPLPTLVEQNRIIANYNSKLNLAVKQEEKAIQLEEEIKIYLYNSLGIKKLVKKENITGLQFTKFSMLNRWDGKLSHNLESNFPIVKIKNILKTISTGTTPPTARKEYFENGKITFYTPADLTNKMYLTESDRKVTQLAIENKKARKFLKNTLLFVGIGSTVGKVGIIKNEYATSNQQITGLNFDESKVEVEFTYFYFNYFQHITTKERTRATIPIVNQSKILQIPFPLPPLNIQREIVARVTKLNNEIKKVYDSAKRNKMDAIKEFEQEIFSK
tara:strand:+ start:4175 stop:5515 length:1341 start_codon:yes stop_codon:yes gene_type:complete